MKTTFLISTCQDIKRMFVELVARETILRGCLAILLGGACRNSCRAQHERCFWLNLRAQTQYDSRYCCVFESLAERRRVLRLHVSCGLILSSCAIEKDERQEEKETKGRKRRKETNR